MIRGTSRGGEQEEGGGAVVEGDGHLDDVVGDGVRQGTGFAAEGARQQRGARHAADPYPHLPPVAAGVEVTGRVQPAQLDAAFVRLADADLARAGERGGQEDHGRAVHLAHQGRHGSLDPGDEPRQGPLQIRGRRGEARGPLLEAPAEPRRVGKRLDGDQPSAGRRERVEALGDDLVEDGGRREDDDPVRLGGHLKPAARDHRALDRLVVDHVGVQAEPVERPGNGLDHAMSPTSSR